MKARIRELIRVVPFQAFVIHMADGRNFRVNRPDFIFASPKDQTWVIVMEEDADRWHHLAPSLIAQVEPVSDASIAS